mgnify:FL=1
MGDLSNLSRFGMYITLGNNATPQITELNGLSFSVKMGVLETITMAGAQQGAADNFPSSTVISDSRKRIRK